MNQLRLEIERFGWIEWPVSSVWRWEHAGIESGHFDLYVAKTKPMIGWPQRLRSVNAWSHVDHSTKIRAFFSWGYRGTNEQALDSSRVSRMSQFWRSSTAFVSRKLVKFISNARFFVEWGKNAVKSRHTFTRVVRITGYDYDTLVTILHVRVTWYIFFCRIAEFTSGSYSIDFESLDQTIVEKSMLCIAKQYMPRDLSLRKIASST